MLWGNGEYLNTGLDTNKHWFTITGDVNLMGSGGVGGQGLMNYVITIPSNKVFKFLLGGLHDAAAVSADSGRVFFLGANSFGQYGNGNTTATNTSFELLYDSAGNPFYNVVNMAACWSVIYATPSYGAVKSDGTVWVWGNLTNGQRGAGITGYTLAKPVQVTLVGGKLAKAIYGGSHFTVLCTDGTVQTWGGTDDYQASLGGTASGQSPQDIGLSHIAMIGVGNSFEIAVDSSHNIFGWGEFGSYMGLTPSGYTYHPVTTPVSLNTALSGLPTYIDTLVCNHTSTIFKLHDGTLWGIGGKEMGQMGNGDEINWANYTVSPAPYGGTPAPYNWNVGTGEYTQCTPVAIAPGKTNWLTPFGGTLYDFYFMAIDGEGVSYAWGRNKNGVIPNSIIPADTSGSRIGGAYACSWDVIWVTMVNPYTLTVATVTTSPTCLVGGANHATTPCTYYTIPTLTAPNASVTNQSLPPGTVVLNGLASTAAHINQGVWSQISGPTTALLGVNTSPTDTIRLTTPGVYLISYTIRDQVGQISSATSTIVIASPGGSLLYRKFAHFKN